MNVRNQTAREKKLYQFVISLDPLQKTMLEDWDRKIKNAQDKPPEYFIDKFQNGEQDYYDSGILTLHKSSLITLMMNDVNEYSLFSSNIMRHVFQLYNDWMESQIMIRNLKRILESKES